MTDDTFLITRLKCGDEKAYKFIFENYYVLMCRVAMAILHDHHEAEDTAFSVICRMYERRDSLNIRSSLRSYLLTSVRNRALNRIRDTHTDTGELTRVLIDNVPDFTIPSSQIIGKELEKEIDDAINKLNPQTRTVFLMSRVQGKSYKDISRLLGISVDTVKYHMKKALATLRKALDKIP